MGEMPEEFIAQVHADIDRIIGNRDLINKMEAAGLVFADPASDPDDDERGYIITPDGADAMLTLLGFARMTAGNGGPLPESVERLVSQGITAAYVIRPLLQKAWPHYPEMNQ